MWRFWILIIFTLQAFHPVRTWSRRSTSCDRLAPCWRCTTPFIDADGSVTRKSSSIWAKSSLDGWALDEDEEAELLPTCVQTVRAPAAAETRPAGILTHCRRRRRERGVGSSSVAVVVTPSRSGGGSGGGGGGGARMAACVVSAERSSSRSDDDDDDDKVAERCADADITIIVLNDRDDTWHRHTSVLLLQCSCHQQYWPSTTINTASWSSKAFAPQLVCVETDPHAQVGRAGYTTRSSQDRRVRQ